MDFDISRLAASALSSISQEYEKIFRGGIILLGTCLLALSQLMPVLLGHEHQAKELEYTVEAAIDKKMVDIDCDTLDTLRIECNMANYKTKVVSSGLKLLITVVEIILYCAMGMILLAITGYVINHSSKKK